MAFIIHYRPTQDKAEQKNDAFVLVLSAGEELSIFGELSIRIANLDEKGIDAEFLISKKSIAPEFRWDQGKKASEVLNKRIVTKLGGELVLYAVYDYLTLLSKNALPTNIEMLNRLSDMNLVGPSLLFQALYPKNEIAKMWYGRRKDYFEEMVQEVRGRHQQMKILEAENDFSSFAWELFYEINAENGDLDAAYALSSHAQENDGVALTFGQIYARKFVVDAVLAKRWPLYGSNPPLKEYYGIYLLSRSDAHCHSLFQREQTRENGGSKNMVYNPGPAIAYYDIALQNSDPIAIKISSICK